MPYIITMLELYNGFLLWLVLEAFLTCHLKTTGPLLPILPLWLSTNQVQHGTVQDVGRILPADLSF